MGTLLPSTEDAGVEPHSLVLLGSDPSGSFMNQEHGPGGFMDQDSEEEGAKEKDDSACKDQIRCLLILRPN